MPPGQDGWPLLAQIGVEFVQGEKKLAAFAASEGKTRFYSRLNFHPATSGRSSPY